jgi:hypothetical protein
MHSACSWERLPCCRVFRLLGEIMPPPWGRPCLTLELALSSARLAQQSVKNCRPSRPCLALARPSIDSHDNRSILCMQSRHHASYVSIGACSTSTARSHPARFHYSQPVSVGPPTTLSSHSEPVRAVPPSCQSWQHWRLQQLHCL